MTFEPLRNEPRIGAGRGLAQIEGRAGRVFRRGTRACPASSEPVQPAEIGFEHPALAILLELRDERPFLALDLLVLDELDLRAVAQDRRRSLPAGPARTLSGVPVGSLMVQMGGPPQASAGAARRARAAARTRRMADS
jgi:hypothetical protein